jgi:hypothetical protein
MRMPANWLEWLGVNAQHQSSFAPAIRFDHFLVGGCFDDVAVVRIRGFAAKLGRLRQVCRCARPVSKKTIIVEGIVD